MSLIDLFKPMGPTGFVRPSRVGCDGGCVAGRQDYAGNRLQFGLGLRDDAVLDSAAQQSSRRADRGQGE